jgi:hypothetical protein
MEKSWCTLTTSQVLSKDEHSDTSSPGTAALAPQNIEANNHDMPSRNAGHGRRRNNHTMRRSTIFNFNTVHGRLDRALTFAQRAHDNEDKHNALQHVKPLYQALTKSQIRVTQLEKDLEVAFVDRAQQVARVARLERELSDMESEMMSAHMMTLLMSSVSLVSLSASWWWTFGKRH